MKYSIASVWLLLVSLVAAEPVPVDEVKFVIDHDDISWITLGIPSYIRRISSNETNVIIVNLNSGYFRREPITSNGIVILEKTKSNAAEAISIQQFFDNFGGVLGLSSMVFNGTVMHYKDGKWTTGAHDVAN